jgi:uncharacterized protein YutE (UPF0331/DUF86 family)
LHVKVGEEEVKPDDEQLEKRRQEMFDRAQKMDALTLSVLRTHLLAEQCMCDYILASDVKRRWLRNKTFSDTMQKCKQLAKDEGDAELWDVLDAANQLRNTIAHTLSIEKIAEKMKQLKERYFAFLTEKQAADLKDRPDDYIAQSALVTCAGFIATLQDRARAKKSAEAS